MAPIGKVVSRSPQATGVAVLLVVACVAGVAVGFHYLNDKKMDADRMEKLREYNAVVQAWRNSTSTDGASNFKSCGNWTIEARDGDHSFFTKVLAIDTNTDALKDHDTKNLPLYDPVKYQFSGSLDFDVKPWRALNATLTFKSEKCNGFFSTTVKLSTEQDYGAVGWKVCDYQRRGAYVNNSKCMVYRKAKRLCLQTAFNSTSQSWGLNTDMPGCVLPEWTPVLYSPVKVARVSGPKNVTFTKLTVALRASTDPWIIAEEVTGGAGDFGLTAEQRIQHGTVFVIGGGICLAIALSLLLCALRECGYYAPVPTRYGYGEFSNIHNPQYRDPAGKPVEMASL